jgi:hypothetical protein
MSDIEIELINGKNIFFISIKLFVAKIIFFLEDQREEDRDEMKFNC